MQEAYIREIFLSIQGEGTHVGEQQLFIRFCGCNLKCNYCDTDFEISKSKKYSSIELLKEIDSYGQNLILSLTGGEPLMSVEFLKEFLPAAKREGHTVYLETNGTLPKQLKQVIEFVDIIAADIKLESSTGMNILWNDIDEFIKISSSKETFAKIVFDEKITENEIINAVNTAQKYNIELILQPKMNENEFSISCEFCEQIFNKFRTKYDKVRLIPQIHKFLNIR